MLDKEKARQIAAEYAKEVSKVLPIDKAILFGSFASGSPHEESDIDVAVFVRGLDAESWYATRILLQDVLWNRTFLDIEPHLLDETDDPSGFVSHVLNTGEVIYAA